MVEQTNKLLKEYAAKNAKSVSFVDCSAPLFGAGGALSKDAIPDSVHPSAAAFEQIAATCLKPAVDKAAAAAA